MISMGHLANAYVTKVLEDEVVIIITRWLELISLIHSSTMETLQMPAAGNGPSCSPQITNIRSQPRGICGKLMIK